jgi:hypothetical protein
MLKIKERSGDTGRKAQYMSTIRTAAYCCIILHPFLPITAPQYSPQFQFRATFRPEYLPLVQGSGLCLPVYTPVYAVTLRSNALMLRILQKYVYTYYLILLHNYITI